MDGLSQDEINALLSGMDLSDDDEPGIVESNEEGERSPVDLSQAMKDAEELLTDVEKDAVGEVANISMGSSATTLYSLVNRRVNITTPVVEFCTWDNLLTQYERPCVFIQIKYTVGLDGTNILILKEHDVKVITDLMMGGDGTNTDGELGELHLSAISEAMNQMMGASATSLSTMMGTKIDISPPEASLLDLTQVKDGSDVSPFLGNVFVKISFKMQIDDLVDSSIMQLYPVDFARKVVDTFMNSQTGGSSEPTAAEPAPTAAADMGMQGGMNAQTGNNPQADMSGMGMNPQMDMSGMGMNPQMMGMNPQMMNAGMGGMPMGMNPQMMGMNPQMMGMNPQMMNMGMGGMPVGMSPQMGMSAGAGMQNINVQPAQFQGFTNDGGNIAGQENIGLIMDVPLNVTVELGRTSKLISEILDFAPGTIIELDRIAGEPIDVLVNGKFVAKGEVVVIEESFGVRVTEIIK
ncbi:flagellar motor switch phosphatase FliY [Acetatifactor muris]|uniref:Flagellar motor switch protein FliN n=1 Tax=Acetatifactor muris TaxID=879566 RepID=A0A2K4ZIL0_9FIRM|nr:flagellar motor switch phosphatase FliY [Acetatifactor muris]MCR2048640.1 flagellar motor switch phosphatase FliY [Acetatifactor muris]SOY30300.1 Flagellar motor switch protein FliN [Acetatifactor muris]